MHVILSFQLLPQEERERVDCLWTAPIPQSQVAPPLSTLWCVCLLTLTGEFHCMGHYPEMELRLHFKPLILNQNYAKYYPSPHWLVQVPWYESLHRNEITTALQAANPKPKLLKAHYHPPSPFFRRWVWWRRCHGFLWSPLTLASNKKWGAAESERKGKRRVGERGGRMR
jgi:hypothetical protein